MQDVFNPRGVLTKLTDTCMLFKSEQLIESGYRLVSRIPVTPKVLSLKYM